MMAKTKLQTLEKRLDRRETPATLSAKLSAKILRWKYGLADNPDSDLITLQEWDEYKKMELKKGTTQAYLDQLEAKIRAKDGFMEIEFVLDTDLKKKPSKQITTKDL